MGLFLGAEEAILAENNRVLYKNGNWKGGSDILKMQYEEQCQTGK